MAEEKGLFDELKVDKRKGKAVKLGQSKDLKSAYRTTQNLPQAVLKVSSYGSGAGRVASHIEYISRDGNLDVEDPQGNLIRDQEERNQRLEEWSTDYDTRAKSRDTVNIVLSAPKGSELGAVESSVRSFARKNFGETNDYLFAIHNDTDHPHGHLVVKMRGYDGVKMNPGKSELREWRESFAESLIENGIEVEASSRLSRGVGRKGYKQEIIHMRERGVIPEVDRQFIKETQNDVNSNIDAKDKPWSKAAKAKTQEHKDELINIAIAAKKAAELSGNINLEIMSRTIYNYAEKIPEPKTRAEELQEKIKQNVDKDIDR